MSIQRPRQRNALTRRPCRPNSIHRGLDGRAPFGHIEVVRLVHYAEDDTGFGGVALGEVGPEVGELRISWE